MDDSQNGCDLLAPENVNVIFEGRPGKAYVSMIDYLDLYERMLSERERAEAAEKRNSARVHEPVSDTPA